MNHPEADSPQHADGSPLRKVRWGILSTASINDVILESCAESEATEFVGVASRDSERARAYAEQRNIPLAFGSYEELLDSPEIEAIYVSVPNGLHMRWSQAALAAGKHVFCEKPLARDEAEIRQTYAIARLHQRVFGEAFMYRHHPQTDLIREVAASGRLGDVRSVLSSHSFLMPTDEYDQRLPAELDAGALMDLGCYQIGMARFLLGEPESVYGEQALHETGVDMQFAGTLHFQRDILAQFDCSMEVPLRNTLEIVGSDAVLFSNDPWHCRGGVLEIRSEVGVEEIVPPRGNAYRLEFESFARAVAGEYVPAFDESDAVAQARIIDALYRSASAGRSVPLRPIDGDAKEAASTHP